MAGRIPNPRITVTANFEFNTKKKKATGTGQRRCNSTKIKSKAMVLSAAATTTTFLLLSTLDASGTTTAASIGGKGSGANTRAQHHRHHRGGLPQHRVRTPKRQVPYPDNHPLGRHLNGDTLELLELEEEEDGLVGGDGSRRMQRQRQRRQEQLQRHQQELNHRHHHREGNGNRLLRFLHPTHQEEVETPKNKKRPRHQIQNENNEPHESIQEGLIKNTEGGTLRYWSISGRNLVDSTNATKDGVGGNPNGYGGYNDNDGAALLVDVDLIQNENDEAGEGSQHAIDKSIEKKIEGKEGSSEEEAAGGQEDGGQSRVLDDDDDTVTDQEEEFDTNQYYNDQQSSPYKPSLDSEQAMDESTTLNEEEDTLLYQPIRLRAIFTDDETSGSRYLTASQRKVLMEDIINPALYAWSKALHVVPVGSGRRRRRRMKQEEGDDEHVDKLVVDKSQLYDGVSCGPGLDSGLPSVRVPREHMVEGLVDTDTVIYLSVTFSEKETKMATAAAEEEGVGEEPFPVLYHLHRGASGPKYGGSLRRADPFGKEDASTVSSLSTTVTNQTSEHPSNMPSFPPSNPPSLSPSETQPYDFSSRPLCTGTYLASSTYCSTDQYDRPVAGILSLCIPSDDVHNFFYDPEYVKRNVVTIMHEIGHILGFNAHSLANFRDADSGAPLTPRDENGDVPLSKVECTGVSGGGSSGSAMGSARPKVEIPLPSKDIMDFQTVRGGVRVATIVTPTVQRVARNMFGCRTLMGAELESGEGQMFVNDNDDADTATTLQSLSAGECIGDHWSRRLFRTDLMNAIVDDVHYSLYISSLTLAYFADTGWYRVDTTRIAPPTMWGRNAGCNFVEKKCITANGHVSAGNNPFFCNNFLESEPSSEEDEEEEVREIHGCSLDMSRKAVCSLVEYDAPLPKEYDYFEQDKYLDHNEHYFGGRDPTLDYCPVFEGFVNGQCEDEDSKKLMEVRSSLEVFGEDNSRCVIGHVERKRTALCLPIACVIQEQSLMVKVDGYWKPCSYAGQIISVWWNPNDYVVCPDPSRMCPTFYCPNDCFQEGGLCNYQTGQCMCATATNSSFSNYYSYQRFEPCAGSGHAHFGGGNTNNFASSSSQGVERIDFELPDYYVENTTVLLDDPRDFDDKVSRMFSQLNTGEVVGLVASFMFCVIFSFIVWSQMVKCYKQRLWKKSFSRVKSSVTSLPGMLRSSSRASLENGHNHHDGDLSPSNRRPGRSRGRNPQKDKMVATLLVQMRTEGTALAEQEQQQRRLELGGLTTSMSDDDLDKKKTHDDSSTTTQTIVDLSSSSDEEVLVNRSDLPPLPEGGRVLAVVGARIVEDERIRNVDDARSSVTSATHVTSPSLISSSHHTGLSEFASPLYQDANEGRNGSNGGRMLRLRRHVE